MEWRDTHYQQSSAFSVLQYSGATANLVTGSSIPLLTPTTLANLEQSFTELANNNEMPVFEPLQQPQTTHVNRESGFVPPVVIIPMNPVKQESSNYQQNTAEDLSDSDWTPPGAKRMKVTAAGSDNTLIKPTYSSPLTTTSTPGRKSTRRLNDSLVRTNVELLSKQTRAFTQCCFNVGPASKTVAQHWNIIGWVPVFAGISPACMLAHYYHGHELI